ncbi:hypothetical protein IAU60_003846 [Kwoniella sp. DSM 27419]
MREQAEAPDAVGQQGQRSNGDHGQSGAYGANGPSPSSSSPPVPSSITPPSSAAFDFSSSSSNAATASNPSHITPNRRRQPPPASIPNFPSSHESRNPPPAIPFSPSPTHSPAASSPFRSPDPPGVAQSSASASRGFAFQLPQTMPSGGGPAPMHSPWLSLAATSGAPTPSLESGPMGRSSPHLGYPFERLNIGGSWSGANLWGEGAQGRRGSQESNGLLGSSPGRSGTLGLSSPPPIVPPPGPVRGLSAETLSRYQAGASGSNPAANASSLSLGSLPKEQASKPAPMELSLPPALARRRGSVPKNLAGPNLSLPPAPRGGGKSPSPLASSSTVSSPGAVPGRTIKPITPAALQPLISSASTLILDVRPPSTYQSSHIPSSHSLPLPSTLLKRPAFTLQKLVQMLPDKSVTAVNAWREKANVVLLDVDSATVSDGSVLDGLASKFEREGYTGQLWFVKGGQQAVEQYGEIELEGADGEEGQEAGGGTPTLTQNKGLMAGMLSSRAFQSESTNQQGSGRAPPPTGLRIPPTPGFSFKSNPFGITLPGNGSATASRSEPSDKHRTNSVGSSEGSSQTQKTKFQPANPFFDNIRQNLELSHGGITERIPLNIPEHILNRAEELPDFLRNLVTMPEKESMDALARQFYQLELSEQKRLQAVMDWHSHGSGMELGDGAGREDWTEKRRNDAEELRRLAEWKGEEAKPQGDYFPFSITAGVERGTKNRYKNIWPYDFSRVRLEQPPDNDSDYINASFVQPRGTSRRYIATQGPLDATFQDFWTLVWEQDVRVIVMITKQFEGGLIKCGNYWGNRDFGPLHLKQVQQSGGEDHAQSATTGFDFGPAAVTPRSSSQPTGKERNIKRVFKLSNDEDPAAPPRTITQIQCIGWPDFDVPETPETLGHLIKEVDQAVDHSTPGINEDRSDQPPVLVHCSAGVGRTGSFIVVDAILDGLRRELRAQQAENATGDYEQVSEAYDRSPIPMVNLTMSGTPSPHDVARNRSGDSGKAVSFLNAPDSYRFPAGSPGESRQQFTTSPTPMTTSDTGRPLTLAALNAQAQEENMDLDPPAATKAYVQNTIGQTPDPRFMQHRGSISTTISDETWEGTRRPSLASTGPSAELLPAEARKKTSGDPSPMTKSDARHRTPSPVSQLDNPVPSVLEGMRVQRMSLVQSLRQYLFVHRAIIHNYVHMLDEFRASGELNGIKSARSRASSLPAHSGLTATSGSWSTEDEAHSKRRASPTELDGDARLAAARGNTGGASGLSKRPSFKKMRQGPEGMASPGPPGAASSSPSTLGVSPASPKSKGRLRSRSKLAPDEGVPFPLQIGGDLAHARAKSAEQ